MANRPRTPPLNLAIQAAYLKKHFPQSRADVQRSCLLWRAVLQPTELSRPYEVSMSYALHSRPRVRVLSPPLELPPRSSEVHVYLDGTLCLYFPGEWTRSRPLVETVVPWICEWLVHYEAWQVTGTWHGGGVHLVNKALMPDVA